MKKDGKCLLDRKGIWDRIYLEDSISLQDGKWMLERRCAWDGIRF